MTPNDYAALHATETALHGLYHDVLNRWPLPSQPPADLAREIAEAFARIPQRIRERAFDEGFDPNGIETLL